MNIPLTIAAEDEVLVIAAFKELSGGYPTGDSDEKIVTDGLIKHINEQVATYLAMQNPVEPTNRAAK